MIMKRRVRILCVLLMSMILSLGMLSTTAFASISKPTDTWNLASSGAYSFSGTANVSTLYSNYYLTGASSVEISVTNYSSKNNLKVKLYKKSAWFFSESSVTVPKSGKTTWTVTGLNSNTSYYLQFNAPSDFSGYIKKV